MLLLQPTVPLLTSLPVSPVDGQVILYQADATNGVVWQFRYNAGSASAHKWEFVGGSDLVNEVVTAQATASNTYVNLTTTGPALTVPFVGDYKVAFGATIEAGLVAGWRGRISITATDAGSAFVSNQGSAGAGSDGASGVWMPTAALSAAQTVTCTYRSDAGNSVTFSNRFLRITPVRVH